MIGDDTSIKKVLSHGWTLSRGRVKKGGLLPSQIDVPSWFVNPNHRAKCVDNMVYELASKHTKLIKLDSLRFKKYYQYYIK